MELNERYSTPTLTVRQLDLTTTMGNTLYGWYVSPAAAKLVPAVLLLPGYGARTLEPPLSLAEQGWAVLVLDVRGRRLDRVRSRQLEDYLLRGAGSPETYVYRELAAGVLTALQFLCFQENVDQQRIAIAGTGEGGGLALLAAALSPAVGAVAMDSPLLVDFPFSMRSAEWPYTQLSRLARTTPDKGRALLHTLSYYDAVNLAPKVHCPVLLSVGLQDRIALPSAVYGLYNVLPGPKEIRLFPKAGHEGGGEAFWGYKIDWLARALERPKP
jgi:cephalosporin-C deacetylase